MYVCVDGWLSVDKSKNIRAFLSVGFNGHFPGGPGLEACPLKAADLKSLDYIVGAFMKIFKTKSKEVATYCTEMFNCPLPSVFYKYAADLA